MEKKAFNIEELAQMYGLNPATVRTNVSRAPSTLPRVTRIGRSIRFLKADIEAWEVSMTDD
jgi:predicted DNA-binding transcriptional regulator AlpA